MVRANIKSPAIRGAKDQDQEAAWRRGRTWACDALLESTVKVAGGLARGRGSEKSPATFKTLST